MGNRLLWDPAMLGRQCLQGELAEVVLALIKGMRFASSKTKTGEVLHLAPWSWACWPGLAFLHPALQHLPRKQDPFPGVL